MAKPGDILAGKLKSIRGCPPRIWPRLGANVSSPIACPTKISSGRATVPMSRRLC